jgi:metallo-beta-lactamase superfamily protein
MAVTRRKTGSKISKPSKPPKPSTSRAIQARVRMYRQGLGDCFLVTFDVGHQEKHMLIDCGTLGATTTGVKLAEVVADIRTTTNDHLHVLVATHEHWDHVAAFGSLEDEFKKIKVDHVWLAWTENPKDVLAQKIAKQKKDLAATLVAAAKALAASQSLESAALGLAVRDVLGFFGQEDVLGAGSFGEKLNEAMQFVRTGLGVAPRYFNPGDGPIEEAWLPGFRIYVLGPPKSEAALNDLGEKGSSELYGIVTGLGAGARLHLSGENLGPYAANLGTTEGRADLDSTLPFDSRFRHERDSPLIQHLLQDTYFAKSEAWRSVDEDWLHVATDLALQLDSATNNTSLALAIERVSDGKVLLFPADAQQGNWLSWHAPAMKWTVKGASGAGHAVTASDLLGRTVFYKVGHHSSHNATARGKGLEQMQRRDELTAFIPVDRAVALGRNPPGSWKMPARTLYRRLLEQCRGRVVRSDIGWATDAKLAADKAVEKEFDGLATTAEWTSWKQSQQAASHISISKLYVEFTLK